MPIASQAKQDIWNFRLVDEQTSSHQFFFSSQFGNLRSTNGQLSPIDWTDFHLSNFAEDPNHFPAASIINLEAGHKKYQMIVNFRTNSKVPLMGGNPFDWMGFNVPFECSINGVSGTGMALFWYPYHEPTDYRDFLRVKRMFYKHDIDSEEVSGSLIDFSYLLYDLISWFFCVLLTYFKTWRFIVSGFEVICFGIFLLLFSDFKIF